MSLWWRVCTAFTESLSLVPGTHVKQFTTAYNFYSIGSNTSFWPPGALHTLIRTPRDTHSYTHLKIKNKYYKKKLKQSKGQGVAAWPPSLSFLVTQEVAWHTQHMLWDGWRSPASSGYSSLLPNTWSRLHFWLEFLSNWKTESSNDLFPAGIRRRLIETVGAQLLQIWSLSLYVHDFFMLECGLIKGNVLREDSNPHVD